MDYALDVCHAVMDVWQPTTDNRIIFNLPSTVEMATPNIYADQIEWMHRNFKERDKVILSLHPHNDRGTGVAATELAVMAGAERIEGTLFGNGERTGNVDIVTLALNMFTQGVESNLDFSDINASIELAEECNELPVHPRHPYAGELVHTAFSGSHQDAIRKGMTAIEKSNSEIWEVPYLPIDPKDIGRSYEAIIRINSQSGKGGVAYIMETKFGIDLPRELQVEFSGVIQKISDRTSQEVMPDDIERSFKETYLDTTSPYALVDYRVRSAAHASEIVICRAKVRHGGAEHEIEGRGNGPINAFVNAMKEQFGIDSRLLDYHQHAVSRGSDAEAACYIKMGNVDKAERFGVGIDANTNTASLRAVISAFNRLHEA